MILDHILKEFLLDALACGFTYASIYYRVRVNTKKLIVKLYKIEREGMLGVFSDGIILRVNAEISKKLSFCLLIVAMVMGIGFCCESASAENINCNPNARDIKNAVCLQDMNDYVRFTMLYNERYKLRDARDGIVYEVAKLDDNNMWLLDNLRICEYH